MKEQTQNGQVANDLVTQKELQQLDKLEKVKRDAESLRQSIRGRILAGAKVEHGPLYVGISESETVQLTETTIRDLLGTLADLILAALPRRQIFRMYLNPSRYINPEAKPTAKFDPARLKASDEPGQDFDLTTFVLKAIPLILSKQDAKSSSSTVGHYVTDDDELEEGGLDPWLDPEVISASMD